MGQSPRNLIEFKSRDIVGSYFRTYFIKTSRFSDVQIIAILKQGESGIPVAQQCREHGMSQPATINGGQSMVGWIHR